MSSGVESAVDVYEELVRETFIDPIRTLVVIDDDYPTLEELVESSLPGGTAVNSTKDYKAVRDFIKFASERPWLMEVHNGKLSTHRDQIRHSDLIVLDYHLQGDGNGGDAAIEFLRSLAQSDHFNLVIVYTKGSDGSHNPVFDEIVVGLTHRIEDDNLDDANYNKVQDILDVWEEEDAGIQESLLEEITNYDFAWTRSQFDRDVAKTLSSEFGQRIEKHRKGMPHAETLSFAELASWLFTKKEAELKPQLCSNSLGKLRFDQAGELNWIASDRFFITVVSKSYDPQLLESKLIAAIKAYFPSPNRLLITKMRSEINERGRIAESTVLSNHHVQTVLLNELLNPKTTDEYSLVSRLVDRHWEAFGDQIRGKMEEFVRQLREEYGKLNLTDTMKKCGLDPADLSSTETILHYNSFVSTKPFDRSHLTTGHVFQIGDGDNSEKWICLSPACDMVPGQKTSRLEEAKPFTAVKLNDVPQDTAVKNATKNIFLFIKINERVATYSTHPAGDMKQNVLHEEMFVLRDGRFTEGDKIILLRSAEDNNRKIQVPDDAGVPTDARKRLSWMNKAREFDGKVIAQLRSEYALNLLQRLGAQVSRAGLGMTFRSRG